MKTFFKFLGKNKLYTAINLFGLAVSLMFVILIADYGNSMLGIDRFHTNKDRIYLIGNESGYSSNHSVSMQLQGQFPEIEKMCGIVNYHVIGYALENNKLAINMLFADSTFFDIFSYPVLSGDPQTALDSQEKAVITKSLALKMFGTTEAIGKIINLVGKETISVTVSAVIKDFARTVLPLNTELITNFQNTKRLAQNDYYSPNVIINGGNGSNKTFIMSVGGADLQAKKSEILKYFQDNDIDYKLSQRKEVLITPLDKVMLDEHNTNSGLEHGNKQMLLILFSAGLAILIFAITNYINLTVAQTGFRSREMASRRLLGASKGEITARLIGESTIMTAIAFAIGLFLAISVQHYASSICGEKLDIIHHTTPAMIAAYIGFIVLLGAVSGIIPAYTLSRFKPIDIVKGTLRYRSKMVFSKIFIILQNTISIVLIVCSLAIYLQINHLVNAPLGHNTKDIIEYIDWDMNFSEYSTFKNELQQLSCVEQVGLAKYSAVISQMSNFNSFIDKDGNEKWITTMSADSNAINILGFKAIRDNKVASGAFYLNEKAAQDLGVQASDSEFSINYGNGGNKKMLGGIFENFRLGNVLREYEPIIITPITSDYTAETYTPGMIFYIKVGGDMNQAIKTISTLYKSVTSKDATFISADEYIKLLFAKETGTIKIMIIFTIIAIIISALGLFAMSTYFTRLKMKEIGIRKIFGGTGSEILRKQILSFVTPLLFSLIIAIPIAYYIVDKWLQNYSWRIEIYPWIFILAGLFIIVIGVITVLGESIKAVNKNPIQSVKAE